MRPRVPASAFTLPNKAKICVVSLCLLILQAALVQVARQTYSRNAGPVHLSETYAQLPLSFEVNQGQSDPRVKFLSRGYGRGLFLTSTEAVLVFEKQSEALKQVRMQLLGGNPEPAASGVDELPSKRNYFIGNDPGKWRTNIATYAKVQYSAVYPGVDLIYYGNGKQLEFDFQVSAEANPNDIRIGFEGTDSVNVTALGDLSLRTGIEEARLLRPIAYQEIDGNRKDVQAEYALVDSMHVRFKVGAYDTHHALIIDPVLSYSTYVGGSQSDAAYRIAVDSVGSAYITGYTIPADLPAVSAIQANLPSRTDAFVCKLNATGSALVYATYLGGSGDDVGRGIAVDAAGNVYIAGQTTSANFPTMSPLQGTLKGGSDAFVTKLNTAGSTLVYSTYLGGTAFSLEEADAIAVDGAGDAYIVGITGSTDFPTVNPFQSTLGGGFDAFVSKLNSAGSALEYSTYLGGTADEFGFGITVDSTGSAYAVGSTDSIDFPTVSPIQSSNGGGLGRDAFVSKLSTGGSLVYSTYLGGSGLDAARGIAIDASGSAYVTGNTSSPNFPTHNPIQPLFAGSTDVFVSKLNPNGSAFVYSTYLGGTGVEGADGPGDIAVDSSGNAYVVGQTSSTNFPTVNPWQPSRRGNADAFLTKLNSTGTAFVYSTYFGGSGFEVGYGVAVDGAGNAFVTGSTWSSNFPTVQPVQEWAGYYDAFVGKFSDGSTSSATLTSIQPKSGQRGTVVNVTLTGTNFATGLTTVGLSNPLNGGPDRSAPVTIGSIHVTSPTSLTATITIPIGAGAGERTVTVTTPGGSSQESVLFSVK